MGKLTKWLLKHSGAEVIVLSRASFDAYHRIVGDRVTYLRAGVDTAKFAPVDEQAKLRLRQEYGIAQDKRVVLHVGHLREGRNVGALCDLDPQNLGVLVLSSETKADRDLSLQQKLEQAPNVMIIDRYIANIQHIYQLADVYLFPVLAEGACIDLPLSVLEAAACGIPVVTTPYGELEALQGREGFLYPDMKDAKAFNAAIREAASWADHRSRAVAMEYDWDRAVEKLTKEGRVCE
jgi:glycosyltransferase involved in cell wall biosynthesis